MIRNPFPRLEWQNNQWVCSNPDDTIPIEVDIERLPRPKYLVNQTVPGDRFGPFHVRRIVLLPVEDWDKIPKDERSLDDMYYNGRIVYSLSDHHTYGHLFSKFEYKIAEGGYPTK